MKTAIYTAIGVTAITSFVWYFYMQYRIKNAYKDRVLNDILESEIPDLGGGRSDAGAVANYPQVF